MAFKCVLSTALTTLRVLTHLALKQSFLDRHYHPHLTDQKIEAHRVK